ncbi:MAG: helix-turn-helix domain-containing protein [Treponema sp.]|jgi:AraC-like DNA-binding protein/ligand-binding sensor protein|nr:helix-turn-helix domain-containing protein [Treponema sp.]
MNNLRRIQEVMTDYSRATGALTSVMDEHYEPIPEASDETGKSFCRSCPKYKEDYDQSCRLMHIEAIHQAQNQGGVCIYHCATGVCFWTSPLFSRGPDRFSGALIGASRPEDKDIKAMADLLLICAESLSDGAGEYYQLLRRRAEQRNALEEERLKLQDQSPESYPLDTEQALLEAIRRGDTQGAGNLLNQILGYLLFVSPQSFDDVKLRAQELAALFPRAGHFSPPLMKLRQARDTEELIDILHCTVESMAAENHSFQGVCHKKALRKAEMLIRENYHRKITLKEIAAYAGLSVPYFSTIFKQEMGETLIAYLNRIRIENASRLLAETDLPLSEIIDTSGFEDQSWFSKTFKAYTGISPQRFRRQGGVTSHTISEQNLSEAYREALSK